MTAISQPVKNILASSARAVHNNNLQYRYPRDYAIPTSRTVRRQSELGRHVLKHMCIQKAVALRPKIQNTGN